MGLFDFFHQLFAPASWTTQFNGMNEANHPEKPAYDPYPVFDPPVHFDIHDPDVRETIVVPSIDPLVADDLPQRYGTFLLVDMYPGEQGGKPKWDVLEQNSRIGNCEVVGAILKATEGSSYRWTDWFVRNGNLLREMWKGRLGRDRFIGAYHYLQLAGRGREQAEFFARTMERIGMPKGRVDIIPALDFEQGGQVNFFPKDCPRDKNGRLNPAALPGTVKSDLVKRAMDTTRTCALRLKELVGFSPMLYGRGLQRDLGMTLNRGYSPDQLRMGCVGAWNPAWTETLPPMDRYGWPLDYVGLWQYGGGGNAHHPKLPRVVPGFGETDMNVHIDGPRRTSLDSFRRKLVCQ